MPRRHRRRKSWLRRNGLLLLVITLIVVPVFGVVAKYIYQNQGQKMFRAKEFYFTSNLLTEETTDYKLNPDATSVSFTLGNNADGLRYAEDEITYNVKVSGEYENAPTLKVGNDISNQGVLENGQITTDVLTLSELEKGVTYTVEATGNAGYKKTISATFTVADDGQNVYKYLDTSNREYVLLTVWAENVGGDVNVQFPAGVIPDNTDVAMRDVKAYAEGQYGSGNFIDNRSFTEKYSSRTYRFFIDNATGVTVDSFTATVNGHIAAKATPQ